MSMTARHLTYVSRNFVSLEYRKTGQIGIWGRCVPANCRWAHLKREESEMADKSKVALRNIRVAVRILERASSAAERGKRDLALAEIENARSKLVFLADYLTTRDDARTENDPDAL
jgi:hypothetical protein